MAVAECVRHGAECPHNHMNLESGALVIGGVGVQLGRLDAVLMNALMQADGVVSHDDLVVAVFGAGFFVGRARTEIAAKICRINNIIELCGWEIKAKPKFGYILKVSGDVVDCEAFG